MAIPPPSPLLALPAEVQLQILEYAVLDQNPVCITVEAQLQVNGVYHRVGWLPLRLRHALVPNVRRGFRQPPITMTCRALRVAALEIYYRENKFVASFQRRDPEHNQRRAGLYPGQALLWDAYDVFDDAHFTDGQTKRWLSAIGSHNRANIRSLELVPYDRHSIGEVRSFLISDATDFAGGRLSLSSGLWQQNMWWV